MITRQAHGEPMSASIVAPTPRSPAPRIGCARASSSRFPTETVYGLGADAEQRDAVRKIFAAKGRPADHPLIVHLPDAAHVEHWARAFPEGARRLAAAFWPGPLTLMLPRAPHASDIVTGGQDSVGLRVPSHPVARELLARFGGGIAAPSANRFGRISPTTAHHVADDLGDAVALILDGGACAVGIESTIVAFVGDDRRAAASRRHRRDDARARAGAGAARARRQRAARIGHAAVALRAADAGDTGRAGCAARGDRAARSDATKTWPCSRARSRGPAEFDDAWLRAPADAAAYAHDLYANLRALDAANADVDPDRNGARRRRVARGPRSPHARDARRGRRPGLAARA